MTREEDFKELLPVHLITVGMQYDQEPCYRRNGLLFYQFLYIEEGEGIFETPDGTYTLRKGTTVFAKKGYPLSYYANNTEFVTGWVTFDGPWAESILAYLKAENFAFFECDAVSFIMASIYKLRWKKNEPAVLSRYVYELVVTFFEEMKQAKSSPILLKAKKFLEENLSNDLSVADISRAVGVSESLLFRIFHDEEKRSPIDFLCRLRIERAKQLLLENSRIRVQEVAQCCGFSDAAYFCKVFRKATGMTPKTYQKNYF